MSRIPRDRDADRSAVRAAADRLLAGTPLRSATGKLTGSELIIESGLRRDVVYTHRDLVEQFYAHVKAQHDAPAAVEKVDEENRALKGEIADLKADLAAERRKRSTLVKLVAELSLEPEQAKDELAEASSVTRLPFPGPPPE